MNIAERLDRVRIHIGRTWDEIGADLGLSRTMLHYVRRGERSLSPKAVVRLRQLETASGLEPPVTEIKITSSPTRDSITGIMIYTLAEIQNATPYMRHVLSKYLLSLAQKLCTIARTEYRQTSGPERKQPQKKKRY